MAVMMEKIKFVWKDKFPRMQEKRKFQALHCLLYIYLRNILALNKSYNSFFSEKKTVLYYHCDIMAAAKVFVSQVNY